MRDEEYELFIQTGAIVDLKGKTCRKFLDGGAILVRSRWNMPSIVYMARAPQAPEKIGKKENFKRRGMASKAGVMRDITLPSLPSNASVMRDAKRWSY